MKDMTHKPSNAASPQKPDKNSLLPSIRFHLKFYD